MLFSRNLDVDGSSVWYDSTPPASQPIIFVHGGFGSSSDLWHLTMQNLPRGAAGYAINNFLRSDPPPNGYSVSSFADRLAHFADALALDLPVIVGHSMGGVVCQIAAIRYPDRFGGMVLVGTGPSMRNHRVGQQLLDRLRTDGFTLDLMREVSAYWFHQSPPGGFFDAYVSRAMMAPLDAMIDVQASLLETDLVQELGRITCPTLIVHGAHDVGRPIEHANALQSGIKGSRLHVCTESGHSPMLETPGDFDAAFHDFLKSLQSSPGNAHSGSATERT